MIVQNHNYQNISDILFLRGEDIYNESNFAKISLIDNIVRSCNILLPPEANVQWNYDSDGTSTSLGAKIGCSVKHRKDVLVLLAEEENAISSFICMDYVFVNENGSFITNKKLSVILKEEYSLEANVKRRPQYRNDICVAPEHRSKVAPPEAPLHSSYIFESASRVELLVTPAGEESRFFFIDPKQVAIKINESRKTGFLGKEVTITGHVMSQHTKALLNYVELHINTDLSSKVWENFLAENVTCPSLVTKDGSTLIARWNAASKDDDGEDAYKYVRDLLLSNGYTEDKCVSSLNDFWVFKILKDMRINKAY